jgi:hypothetical protein
MQSQTSAKRFSEKLLKLGLFQKDEIETLFEPTKLTLENKIKQIEQQIEANGRAHSTNTFLLVYYFGPA